MEKDDLVPFKLNMPATLKQTLEHLAVDSRRSLSAEIIARLEDSVEDSTTVFVSNESMEEFIAFLKKRDEEIRDLEVKQDFLMNELKKIQYDRKEVIEALEKKRVQE